MSIAFFRFLLLLFPVLIFGQPRIFLIGDSTMSEKVNPDQNPERGWGQLLPEFFLELRIENHAVNGRSTKSFITEQRWEKVYNSLKEGDYVFIQFGHNDQKYKDPKRFTNPFTQYRANLIHFVEQTRSKGANPVLFTSVVRRNFNEYGALVDTHGSYPLVVHWVAETLTVPLVDLQLYSEQLELAYGVEGSKKLHLHFKKGTHPYYKEEKVDNTHYSVEGARAVAHLVAKDLYRQNILREYLLLEKNQ